jgi:hypothetical protein
MADQMAFLGCRKDPFDGCMYRAKQAFEICFYGGGTAPPTFCWGARKDKEVCMRNSSICVNGGLLIGNRKSVGLGLIVMRR